MDGMDRPIRPPLEGEPLRPTDTGERVEIVDVLRGFAVLGILLVNMAYFKTPMMLQVAHVRWWPDPLNVTITTLIRFFAEQKFIMIFSLLFGLGMAIQMERADARGAPFVPVWVRRIFILLAIGWCHAFLVWFGDILAPYAFLGLFLLLFRKRKPRTLVVWIVIFLLLPVLIVGGLTGLVWVGMQVSSGEVERAFAEQAEQVRMLIDRAQEVYSSGTYAEITLQRLNDVGSYYSYFFVWGPTLAAYFLFGLYLGRRRFFHRLDEHVPSIRRWVLVLLALGVVGNAVYTILIARTNPMMPTWSGWIAQIAGAIGIPALSLFYLSSLSLLWQQPSWRRRLAHLAPVGRMALTNYLTHSLVCTLVFYSYGLGLFGRVPAWGGLLLALGIFAVQIPLSAWWLKRFRFGPAEWAWRSLTYLELQPFRRR